jgi:hypothetical protein
MILTRIRSSAALPLVAPAVLRPALIPCGLALFIGLVSLYDLLYERMPDYVL